MPTVAPVREPAPMPTVPPVRQPDPMPTVTPVVPPQETAAATAEEIEPTAGRLSRLRGRLARSQNAFGRSLLGLLGAGTLDEDSWTEVEDTLLMADLGAQSAADLTDRLRAEVAAQGVTDAVSARRILRSVLVDAVGLDLDRSVRALPHDGRPSVILVVGVNGTGKTTTTGKLARVLVADGRHVVLGAADTFRAAAADQLATWAERVGAHVVRSGQGADPAAVAFDAVKYGITEGADAVLIDTAGRLHTKTGLMDELGKVKRVVEKQAVVDEVLLVIDATTGQNGSGPGEGLRRCGGRHRDRADQTGRHGQGRHRDRGPAGPRRAGQIGRPRRGRRRPRAVRAGRLRRRAAGRLRGQSCCGDYLSKLCHLL